MKTFLKNYITSIYNAKKHVIIDTLEIYHIFKGSHNQSQAQGSAQ